MTTHDVPATTAAVGKNVVDMLDHINDQVMSQAAGLSEGRRARLSETIYGLYRALTTIADRPDEPIDSNVITFHRRWQSGAKSYSFAALKCGDGYWYVTGTESRYSWEGLLDFIGDDLTSLRYLQVCASEENSGDADR